MAACERARQCGKRTMVAKLCGEGEGKKNGESESKKIERGRPPALARALALLFRRARSQENHTHRPATPLLLPPLSAMSDAKAAAALERAAAACPSAAPALAHMRELHAARLWHQLTDAVEAALAAPEFR